MDDITLAHNLLDAGHAGDWQPLVNRLDDNVVFKLTIPDGTPIRPEIRGKEAVVDLLMRLGELLDFRQEQPLEFFANGNRVVALGQETVEVKKTGVTISGSEYVTIFDFREGVIIRFLIIQDMSAFVDAYRDRSM